MKIPDWVYVVMESLRLRFPENHFLAYYTDLPNDWKGCSLHDGDAFHTIIDSSEYGSEHEDGFWIHELTHLAQRLKCSTLNFSMKPTKGMYRACEDYGVGSSQYWLELEAYYAQCNPEIFADHVLTELLDDFS